MRVSWLIALCVWICFIWANSLVSGEPSDSQSFGVVAVLEPLFHFFGVHERELMNYMVRKAAHASEYAVFGFLDGMAFLPSLKSEKPHATRSGSAMEAIAFCVLVLVPCVDESIQRFVPGRNGNITDVLIDLVGASVGFMVALAIAQVRVGSGQDSIESRDHRHQ